MDDTSLQDQLLTELAPFIHAGRIVVHDSDTPWYTLMRARFPTGKISGISWDAVPGAQSNFEAVPDIPLEGIDGDVPVREHASVIRRFLSDFAVSAGIGSCDNVIVVGDGVTEIAFEMSFDTLLETFQVFFSYPQHTYVIKSDGSWCFVFKFEFDMYFGKAPKDVPGP